MYYIAIIGFEPYSDGDIESGMKAPTPVCSPKIHKTYEEAAAECGCLYVEEMTDEDAERLGYV